MKKGLFLLVRALFCLVHCDTVGWVTERDLTHKNPATYPQRIFPEQLEKEDGGNGSRQEN